MDFPSLFTQSKESLFLNAGTLSRTPLFVLDQLEKEARESEENPTKALYQSYPRLWSSQKALARFLSANPTDLFFRSNISEALSQFIFSVPLQKNAEILVTGWEYGATSNMAAQRAKQSGLSFQICPLPVIPEITSEIMLAKVIDSFSENTAMLVISHVATALGNIFPIERIAAAAAKKGIIVVVDGAHAVGSLNLDFSLLSQVDFYGGNLHKWFMGPKGTAFGWVNPKWRGKIPWCFGGWASFEVPSFYQNFADGDHEASWRLFAGTINPAPFFALDPLLQFWEKNADAIRQRLLNLRALCAEEAQKISMELAGAFDPSIQGPLLSFHRPKAWGQDPSDLLATKIYRSTSVQLALPAPQGIPLVRFSPGIYTQEGEIKEAFQRLAIFKP